MASLARTVPELLKNLSILLVYERVFEVSKTLAVTGLFEILEMFNSIHERSVRFRKFV